MAGVGWGDGCNRPVQKFDLLHGQRRFHLPCSFPLHDTSFSPSSGSMAYCDTGQRSMPRRPGGPAVQVGDIHQEKGGTLRETQVILTMPKLDSWTTHTLVLDHWKTSDGPRWWSVASVKAFVNSWLSFIFLQPRIYHSREFLMWVKVKLLHDEILRLMHTSPLLIHVIPKTSHGVEYTQINVVQTDHHTLKENFSIFDLAARCITHWQHKTLHIQSS